MKTIWEILDEKFSNTAEKNTLKKIQTILEGDILAGDGYSVILTTMPTVPFLQKNGFRLGVILQANLDNTDIIYVGMTNRVDNRQHFIALDAGDYFQINGFKGELYAISKTGTQNLQYAEF